MIASGAGHGQLVKPGLAGLGHQHLVAVEHQRAADRGADAVVVIDYENLHGRESDRCLQAIYKNVTSLEITPPAGR